MKRVTLIIATILASSMLVGSPATAFAHGSPNPTGNNGFVKIDDEVVPDTIPQNHPHVGCTFKVEFYDYDQNNTNATVDFALQAPTNGGNDTLKVTSGDLHPFIGGDAAGGGNDLDARQAYTLSFTGTPQPNQGYHVKLTVDAPGSQGNDKKYKVFWVEPCAPQILDQHTGSTPTPGKGAGDGQAADMAAVLPNTGPGNAFLLQFVAISILGALGYDLWRSHRQVSTK